jgi:hypothetical protein
MRIGDSPRQRSGGILASAKARHRGNPHARIGKVSAEVRWRIRVQVQQPEESCWDVLQVHREFRRIISSRSRSKSPLALGFGSPSSRKSPSIRFSRSFHVSSSVLPFRRSFFLDDCSTFRSPALVEVEASLRAIQDVTPVIFLRGYLEYLQKQANEIFYGYATSRDVLSCQFLPIYLGTVLQVYMWIRHLAVGCIRVPMVGNTSWPFASSIV